MIDPLEVINSCARLVDFCSRMKDVGLENKVFSRLIQRVREDVEEAFRLMRKPEIQAHFEVDPDKEKRVNGAILSVKTAINNIARFVEALRVQKERDGSIGMINRLEWVLRHQSKLNSRQLELDTCHKSLLQTISAMQLWELFPPVRSIEISPMGSILLPPRARLRMRRGKIPENLIDLDDAREIIVEDGDQPSDQSLGCGAFGPSAITLVDPDIPALAELPITDVDKLRRSSSDRPHEDAEGISTELPPKGQQQPMHHDGQTSKDDLHPETFQETRPRSRMSDIVESPFEDGLILADEIPERPKSSLGLSSPISLPSTTYSDDLESQRSRSESANSIVLEFEWEMSPSFSDLVGSALPQLQICQPRLSRYRKKRASQSEIQKGPEEALNQVDEGKIVVMRPEAEEVELSNIVEGPQAGSDEVMIDDSKRRQSFQEDIRKRKARQNLVMSGM